MQKGVILFWVLFSLTLVFALGVQFAYSQSSSPFATSVPSSGVSHDSSEILCSDCITSNNLADGSVTSGEIATGAIYDSDVSTGAGIFSRKINGANGYHFTTGVLSNVNQWYSTNYIGSTGMGSYDWSRIQITCEPLLTTPDNQITVRAGLGKDSIYRENSRMIYFSGVSSTQIFSVYLATSNNGAIVYQQLDLRLNPSDSTQFQFRRMNPSVNANEPAASTFECYFEILSTCANGPSFGSSCG